MKILAYITSLILSAFTYLLFATYLTVSAGLNSYLPIISFYASVFIFGVFSWLHFFKPKLGAVLLTIFILISFFSFPMHLLINYFFTDNGYKPSLIEGLIPLILGVSSIFFVWKGKNIELDMTAKIILIIPPLLTAIYIGGYFTIMAFG